MPARNFGAPYRAPYAGGRRPGPPPGHRPPYRAPYRPVYGYPALYGYANGAYLAQPYVLDPWLWNDSGYYDDSENNGGGYPDQPPYEGQGYNGPQGPESDDPADQNLYPESGAYPQVRPDYNPQPNPPRPPAAPPAAAAPATMDDRPSVTLVFKDNRPAQQVHNYALTRSTLYVLDGRSREIPLDQIDLTATVKTNREAGIDFALPSN